MKNEKDLCPMCGEELNNMPFNEHQCKYTLHLRHKKTDFPVCEIGALVNYVTEQREFVTCRKCLATDNFGKSP